MLALELRFSVNTQRPGLIFFAVGTVFSVENLFRREIDDLAAVAGGFDCDMMRSLGILPERIFSVILTVIDVCQSGGEINSLRIQFGEATPHLRGIGDVEMAQALARMARICPDDAAAVAKYSHQALSHQPGSPDHENTFVAHFRRMAAPGVSALQCIKARKLPDTSTPSHSLRRRRVRRSNQRAKRMSAGRNFFLPV